MTTEANSSTSLPVFWQSTIRLLVANLLVLAIAIYWQWNPLEIILLFAVQSIIIGFTQRLKIRDMIEHESRSGTLTTSYVVNPFLRPEGHTMFTILYCLILLPLLSAVVYKFIIEPKASIPFLPALVGSVLFLIVHWWSYQANRVSDRIRKLELNNAVFFPIVRLIPLYIVVVGVNAEYVYTSSTIIVWILIKTVVDVGVHIHEHKENAESHT